MASPYTEVLPLATLDEAKRHLRIDDPTESPIGVVDQLVQEKLLQATDIVIDYLKTPDNGWDETTVPPLVKSAILLVLSGLYDHPDQDPLSSAVCSILHRYRDPALA